MSNPTEKVLSPEYHAFMRSDAWRSIRSEALMLYGRRCAGCMGSDVIHMHHLFYPKVLNDTRERHILPLCEKCHDKVHAQRLFHPTVFDESQCAEKRRQTIVYLQGLQRAIGQFHGKRRPRVSKLKLEKIERSRPRLWERRRKSHIFMSHAEYLAKMPPPE